MLIFLPVTFHGSAGTIVASRNYRVSITGEQVFNSGQQGDLYVHLSSDNKSVVGKEIRLIPGKGSVENSDKITGRDGIAIFTFEANLDLREKQEPVKVVFNVSIHESAGWINLSSDFFVTVYPPDMEPTRIEIDEWMPEIGCKDLAARGVPINIRVESGWDRIPSAIVNVMLVNLDGEILFSDSNITDTSGVTRIIAKYPDAPDSGYLILVIKSNRSGYIDGITTLPIVLYPHSMVVKITFTPAEPRTTERITINISIFDRDTGKPIQGAYVKISDIWGTYSLDTIGPQEGITDAFGNFTTYIYLSDAPKSDRYPVFFFTIISEDYARAQSVGTLHVRYYNPGIEAENTLCLSIWIGIYITIILIAIGLLKWGRRIWN